MSPQRLLSCTKRRCCCSTQTVVGCTRTASGHRTGVQKKKKGRQGRPSCGREKDVEERGEDPHASVNALTHHCIFFLCVYFFRASTLLPSPNCKIRQLRTFSWKREEGEENKNSYTKHQRIGFKQARLGRCAGDCISRTPVFFFFNQM